MTIRAVLLAGGVSRRMRATAGPRHKCLLELLGVPIMERNIAYLLSSGFRDLVAVTGAGEHELIELLETRGRALAAARGGKLDIATEPQPVGTIGSVAALAGEPGPLLVLNADNLTALDLRALAEHHRAEGAAMTVATHQQPFPIPWGEVESTQGWISRYMEKPLRRIPISSGIYMVGAAAVRLIPPGTHCDMPELVERLLARHMPVAAFVHEAPWIDINDAAALDEAARLVGRHADRFELWPGGPDRSFAGLLARDSDRFLAERRGDGAQRYPGCRDLPGVWMDEADADAAAGALAARYEPASPLRRLAVFDDLDPRTRQLIRHHVFVAQAARLPAAGIHEWLPLHPHGSVAGMSPPLRRAIAHWESAS